MDALMDVDLRTPKQEFSPLSGRHHDYLTDRTLVQRGDGGSMSWQTLDPKVSSRHEIRHNGKRSIENPLYLSAGVDYYIYGVHFL